MVFDLAQLQVISQDEAIQFFVRQAVEVKSVLYLRLLLDVNFGSA